MYIQGLSLGKILLLPVNTFFVEKKVPPTPQMQQGTSKKTIVRLISIKLDMCKIVYQVELILMYSLILFSNAFLGTTTF